jgi:hypothetical protein
MLNPLKRENRSCSGKESYQYLLFVVPYEQEDKLPFLLAYIKVTMKLLFSTTCSIACSILHFSWLSKWLQKHAGELLIDDLQLRMTPLEEVFLNVTRKAELENAEVGRKSQVVEYLLQAFTYPLTVCRSKANTKC